MFFKNRIDAGQQIARKLKKYKGQKDTIVVALPRGGVVNGYEIAKFLNLPLDIIISKKIGAPGNEEFAIGSVNQDGTAILNDELVKMYNISPLYIKEETERVKRKVEEKWKILKGDARPTDFTNKTVILADDGIATGYTMKSAIAYLKNKHARKIIVAVPVAPKEAIEEIKKLANEVICLQTPFLFGAIGAFYENFKQVEDEEVKKYLSSY